MHNTDLILKWDFIYVIEGIDTSTGCTNGRGTGSALIPANYPMMLTGVLVTAIPMIVLFLLLQRYFVAGLTAGSLKG